MLLISAAGLAGPLDASLQIDLRERSPYFLHAPGRADQLALPGAPVERRLGTTSFDGIRACDEI